MKETKVNLSPEQEYHLNGLARSLEAIKLVDEALKSQLTFSTVELTDSKYGIDLTIEDPSVVRMLKGGAKGFSNELTYPLKEVKKQGKFVYRRTIDHVMKQSVKILIDLTMGRGNNALDS